MKYILSLCLFIIVSFSYSQNFQAKKIVVDATSKLPLENVLVFNETDNSATNDDGKFQIPTVVNDTIYISYLGYQSIKLKITNDLLKGNDLVIELH